MSRLIESIKLLDGKLRNLSYHEERMRKSFAHLFPSYTCPDLRTFLHTQIIPQHGLYKCRIEYDATSTTVTFTPYEVRAIRSVRVVEDDDISYSFKFADRGPINRLFDMRRGCDDVLIVRHGRVTDCSYSNVVLRKGTDWYTPDSPLLEGTMRARLVRENLVGVREIRMEDIRSFDSLRIVNAMVEFDGPEIDVSDIVF